MIGKYRGIAVALVVPFVFCVHATLAQISPDESGAVGVVGTGTATIERQPEILRLQLMITADGKDVKEALGKLKEKETAAKAKLAKMGAAESSISFADAAPQEQDPQQQMNRMIQARSGHGAKTAKGAAQAVTLFTTLKAEWPLTSKTTDDLLVESQDIHDKVKVADLTAEKVKPANAEQEEAAEEAQGMNNDGQPNPRDPIFLFVSKITDDDRDKAQAEAYKKASKDAQRLAKASGGELGPVHLLVSRATSGAFANYNRYDPYRQQAYENGGDEESGSEAVGIQPGKVSYRLTVSVAFAIKG